MIFSFFCRHSHMVRERRKNGAYGYRCLQCQKPYPRTWNDITGVKPARGKSVHSARTLMAGANRDRIAGRGQSNLKVIS